jgi:hypothetical protein
MCSKAAASRASGSSGIESKDGCRTRPTRLGAPCVMAWRPTAVSHESVARPSLGEGRGFRSSPARTYGANDEIRGYAPRGSGRQVGDPHPYMRRVAKRDQDMSDSNSQLSASNWQCI